VLSTVPPVISGVLYSESMNVSCLLAAVRWGILWSVQWDGCIPTAAVRQCQHAVCARASCLLAESDYSATNIKVLECRWASPRCCTGAYSAVQTVLAWWHNRFLLKYNPFVKQTITCIVRMLTWTYQYYMNTHKCH